MVKLSIHREVLEQMETLYFQGKTNFKKESSNTKDLNNMATA